MLRMRQIVTGLLMRRASFSSVQILDCEKSF
jgi:hypothetical protein